MHLFIGLLLLAGRFVLPAVVSRREAAARKLEELRQEKETFTSMGKVENRLPATLDIKSLLDEEVKSFNPKFVHAQPFIAALRRGEEKFEVVEHNVDVDEWDPNDVNDKGRAIFETTTSYQLKAAPENYLLLDDIKEEDASSHIRGLSEDHILHCGRALESGLLWQSGSIVLGTERGAWSRIPHVSRHLDEAFSTLHINHAVGRRIQGFLVLRRITEIRATDNSMCTKFHTEPVHPIELFKKFRVESLGQRPYNHNYGNYESVADERKLFSKLATPDSPIQSCTSQSFAPFTSGFFGNYDFVLGIPSNGHDDATSFVAEASIYHGGCVEYSQDFSGGFNFNYDSQMKGAITKNLPLGGSTVTGVTCNDCYAYLGAGFLLILEYDSSFSISAEGKIAGGAGFNAAVNIVNPTVSGSASITLVNAATSWGGFSLGSGGLQFKYKFGGLTALVSGSGSATGTAAFGAGMSVSASLAAKYSYSTVSFPYSYSGTSVTPYYTSTGFKATSMSVSATLTGTENFAIQYSSLLTLSFLFDGNLAGTMSYTMGNALSSSSTAQVTVIAMDATTNRRALDQTGYFMPGDLMTIQFVYDGYPSQESITLFYSFVKTSGEVMDIMMQHFNTSVTGTGVLEATWLVPWDEFLSEEWPQKDSQVIVKASTDISKEYSASGFGVKIFTEVDGVFLSPAPGEMVPVDTPYEVTWNSSLLKTFVPNAWNRPDGKIMVANTVVFELCGESLAANGTILSWWCENFQHDHSYLNVGSAQMVFFSNFSTRADRFYLNVHSKRHLKVYGWSPGYFRLVTGRVSSAALANLRVATVGKHLAPKVFRRQTPRTDSSTEAKRKLPATSACSGSSRTSSVSFGANAGGNPKALQVSTYSVPLGSSSGANPVVTPAAVCYVDDSSAPTPQPTPLPTSSMPTFIPTRLPTPLPGTPTLLPTYMPTTTIPTPEPTTPSPTLIPPTFAPTSSSAGIVPTAPILLHVIQVQVGLTGVDVTTATSAAFQIGFIAASASVLQVPTSAISITSVSAARRRLLSGVSIVSQITSTTVTAHSVMTMTPSVLVTALTNSLPAYTLTVGAISTIDLSPTSAPSFMTTTAPVSASTTVSDSSVAIIAGVVGGVGALLIVVIVGLFCYSRSRGVAVVPAQ